MSFRILALAVILLLSAGYVATISRSELVFAPASLGRFPLIVEGRRGLNAPGFPENVLAELGVDEYLNRVYYTDPRAPIGLYVGYYASQRQGDTIHSPRNCLPGAGWQPVEHTYLAIPVGLEAGSPGRRGHLIVVNRYLIEKGLDRQLVLYWYQSHGRVVANEYRSKLYMVYDALRLNRTDAALVRVVTPIVASEADAGQKAEARATRFVQATFPLLSRYLPS